MNYNIKEELIIRKIIEKNTDWNLEINQNYKNKYGYDLELYKHITNSSEVGFEKKFICYIEVEYGESWKEYDLPKNWIEISFLKRKCFKYNFNTNQWTNEPKNNYDKCIYLKTNFNYTNCYYSKIEYLINCSESKRSKGCYKNSFISCNKDDKNIMFGFKNLNNYLKTI